jgi:sporulation integral membrane protein YtvI
VKLIENDYKPLIILFLTIAISALAILLILKYLLPLFIGILIAILAEPLINFLSKRTKLTRGISAGLIIFFVFIAFLYGLILVIMRLLFELRKLINMLPNINNIIDELTDYFINIFESVPDETVVFLEANINQILKYIEGLASNFYGLLVNKIGMLPNVLINVFIFMIFTLLFGFFLTKDKNSIILTAKRIIPSSLQNKLKAIHIELLFSFVRLLKAQIVLVMISTLITVTGFYILKVEYALILGLLCGLLDILPVVGPSIIFVPWIIFCLITGNIVMSIGLLVLYLIVLGSRQLLQAKIIGYNLGIDPFITLLSIYLGIQFFGVLGLFIGPIVVVIVRALLHSGLIPPLYNNNR